MPTPHNSANKGDIAKTVLMPGDPLRAQFIAETYLDNAVQFNSVRAMLGFTGTYKGKPVSVMGSGMGIPSIGIYSYELFTMYDVDNIIRLGSCGGYLEGMKLYDTILVLDSYSESSYAKVQNGFGGNVIPASAVLVDKLRQSAKAQNIAVVEGRIHSSDAFYGQPPAEGEKPRWQIARDDYGCAGVEMESFGLFHNANVTGKNAACLATVSDIIGGAETTAEERQKSFTNMMEIALGIL